MSSMQAALGLAQLERLDELIAKKRSIFSTYEKQLATLPITLNAEPPDTYNSYWMVTAVLDGELSMDTWEVREALQISGIDTRPFFHPLSSIPAFAGTRSALTASGRNSISADISRRAMNLPSALSLTTDEIVEVCDILKGLLRGK